MNLIEYCRENKKAHLLEEWDKEKNTGLDMASISYASHQTIWWKCREGHTWQAKLKDRTLLDQECPYCSGKKAWPGYNDLASQAPEVAKEWHPEKNGALTPDQVTCGSARNVWWKCSLGHEWQATVENRAMKGNACPYCSGRKAWPGYNDLETLYPALAKQWHPTMNQRLKPTAIRPGCGRKVWWMCPEGHVWEARVFSRTSKKGAGCPICAKNPRPARNEDFLKDYSREQ